MNATRVSTEMLADIIGIIPARLLNPGFMFAINYFIKFSIWIYGYKNGNKCGHSVESLGLIIAVRITRQALLLSLNLHGK